MYYNWVTIICHFDPERGVKGHPIKKYQKKFYLRKGFLLGQEQQ